MINKDGNKVVVIYGRKREKKKKDAQRFCQKIETDSTQHDFIPPSVFVFWTLERILRWDGGRGRDRAFVHTTRTRTLTFEQNAKKKNRKKKIENDKIFLIVINLKIIVCRVCVCVSTVNVIASLFGHNVHHTFRFLFNNREPDRKMWTRHAYVNKCIHICTFILFTGAYSTVHKRLTTPLELGQKLHHHTARIARVRRQGSTSVITI